MSTTIHQRVMHYAHIIYQSGTCTWSEAVQRAWDLHYMHEFLAHGVIEFTFIKKNGTLRTARGTNYPDLIPPRCTPSGKQEAEIEAGLAEPNYRSIAYFDLDKEAWRSFSIDRFISLDRVMAITPIEC